MSARHTSVSPDLVRAMGPVARQLLGDPVDEERGGKVLCFGTGRGSLKVDLEKGVYVDHKDETGGGVIDLVRLKRNVDKNEALDWLRQQGHLPKARQENGTGKRKIGEYDYNDLTGKLLFQVVRFEPKDFRQRAPNGHGGWNWKMEGVERVIYRLPEVAAAISAGRTVYIAEGEKAVDALTRIGITGTCSPGGANKWKPEYSKFLAGADVVILPDADEPGQKHADSVARALQGIARQVKVLALPGLPHKGDVADWIAAGGTAHELEELARAAAPIAADKPAPKPEQANAIILCPSAPLQSARQYIDLHHICRNTRALHHQNGTFYAWRGSHYVELTTEEIRASLYRFLDKAKRNDDGTIKPFNPTKNKVANILEATAAETQLSSAIRTPTWLDEIARLPANEIISCNNCMLHLPTRQTIEHNPNFFTLNALEFAYDANAPEPKEWLKFLSTIWPNDPQAIETLQEIFGLCLTGDTRHQKAFLIVGPKRSGKGTIARVLTQLLGAANVCGPTLSGLGTNFGLAPLIGKHLAIVSDARLSGKADQQVIVERLLAITGEDGLTIDRKFREAWTGRLDVRFLILTNELPRLTDSSGALAGRFIILAMTQSFFGKEDLGLGARLTPELPGILLWAIKGWERLAARGYFVPPASSDAAIQEMADLGSPIGAFLRDRCIVGQGQSVRVDEFYSLWCRWCGEQGRDHPGTKATFGRDLAAAVPGLKVAQHWHKDGTRHRYYSGVTVDPQASGADRHAETRVSEYCGANFYPDDPGP